MAQHGPFNVLFLCTGNSARSIMAEAILNNADKATFRAFSAGSHPTGTINPFALEILEKNRLPTQGLRSKDWSEFSRPGAPFLHFVFTVCDQAAAEPCPVWPGQPMTAHWGVPDPAAVEGTEEAKRKAFFEAFTVMQRRILLLINLPLETLSKLALQEKLNEKGLGEIIATFGLISVIMLALRYRAEAIPITVAAFITNAFWFTSSTSFANPAVTVARAMTNTFSGISPESVPLFVGGQVIGGIAAVALVRWLTASARHDDGKLN